MEIIRATEEDAAELLAIYAPYVTDTAITFEYDVPTEEEFRGRIKSISAKFPYLKAVGESGEILGYAYATTFKGRAAYDWSVETTVYVRQDARRGGIGRALYAALEASLADMGIINANACIAMTPAEDPRLTNDSVSFHARMGYAPVGVFHQSGYKFGTWYDMIWMEKMLGEHPAEPAQVRFGDWRLVE